MVSTFSYVYVLLVVITLDRVFDRIFRAPRRKAKKAIRQNTVDYYARTFAETPSITARTFAETPSHSCENTVRAVFSEGGAELKKSHAPFPVGVPWPCVPCGVLCP